jgi:hypothetical protein
VAEWQYVAQHPFTGDILDTDIPLSKVSLTRRLSGPWSMAATMAPDVARMLRPGGGRLLDEWAVQVWASCDGVIRGGGIFTGGTIDGPTWNLTFDGHARYPYGIPYTGDYAKVGVDALDAFREVWRHVQSFPDGDLGLEVDTITTGGDLLLGIAGIPAYYEVSFSAENTDTKDRVWVREDSVPASQVNKPAHALIATAKTKLAAAINATSTTLEVTESDFNDFPVPFTIKIGSERIRVGALSSDGRTMSSLTRGYNPDSGNDSTFDRDPHAVNSDVEFNGMGKDDTHTIIKDASRLAGIEVPFTIKVGTERIRVRERNGRVLSRLIRGWNIDTQDQRVSLIDPHAAGATIEYAGTPRRKVEKVEAQPYRLAWWDSVDCGDELETLAKETPVEFEEVHAWSGDTVKHRLRLGYPSLGRKRTDIAFVEGENLAVIPTVDRNGDVFAQYVIGVGAGEGRKRRRTPVLGSPDGRLRRPYLLERSDVTSTARLTRLAHSERAARSTMASIPDVILKDHPNAPLGSWELGDQVLVTLREGWADESVWCRIVEETITPETAGQIAALKLTRADGV